jgi:hypothetical protein
VASKDCESDEDDLFQVVNEDCEVPVPGVGSLESGVCKGDETTGII